MAVDLTLGDVMHRLHQVHNAMAEAQQWLARQRDAEVGASEVLIEAKARAMLDDECPRPKRGENGVTVADRDSWVDQQVADQRADARAAEAARKAAEDHLRVVRDQASVVQSLASLMRAEMQLAGSVD